MIRTWRIFTIGCTALLLGACASRYSGHHGPQADALANVGTPSGLLQHLPRVQQHPAPLGPVQDAYPVVQPAQVKQVWIYPHKNAHGDMIAGHYVFVLYKDTDFADLPGGDARVPVSPKLESVQEEPCCPETPAPIPPLPVQPTPAPQPAPSATSQEQTNELMKRIQAARQKVLQQQSGNHLEYTRPGSNYDGQ